MKHLNKFVGTQGELSVEKYLRKKSYKILQTNFKTKLGEFDIVAKDRNTIVFIEVKRRESLAFGRPSEAVDVRKQSKIRRTAEGYLIRNKLLDVPVRFDVVELVGEIINHIENAF